MLEFNLLLSLLLWRAFVVVAVIVYIVWVVVLWEGINIV